MSIASAIRRSKDDLNSFNTKSYSNLKLGFEVIDSDIFLNSKDRTDMKERFFKREYSVDKAPNIIKIYNKGKEHITINQIRDFFDDIGFNVDTTFSEIHNADIMLVYNVGGYLVPGWKNITKLLSKKRPHLKKLLLTKLAPGTQRLHCRLYHENDGCWYMTSHLDLANWMNVINPVQMVRSHFQKGTGVYPVATSIMEEVLTIALEKFNNSKNFNNIDVEKIYKKYTV